MINNQENTQKGSYLKANTIDKGISQKQIQDDLGVSQQYVSALLNGKKSIGKKIAKKLSELYGLDEVSLLFGGAKQLHEKEDRVKEESIIKNKPHDEQMEILYSMIEELKDKIDGYEERDRLYLRAIAAKLDIKLNKSESESEEKQKSNSN